MGLMDSLLNSITPTKKPGEFCVIECKINDIRCEACLAEQDKIRAAVEELQNLEFAFENAANAPRAAEEYHITKCSLCGAPAEKAEQSCPYCGEPYPARAVTADIPTSKIEQDNMLLQKASAIYDMYAALKKRVYDSKGSDMKGKLGFLGGAVSALYATTNKFVDMTSQDIRKLAQQNGVGYCDYVVGVMQGVYQSAGDIRLQQIGEAAQKIQQQASSSNPNHQIYVGGQSNNAHRIYMHTSPPPQYNGGGGGGGGGSSSKCCGNCRHFMAADTNCAIHFNSNNFARNASDSCNDFSSR